MVPPGACDSHMHFFDSAYPFAADAALTHATAGVAEYRLLQQRLGLERCVIVQPSSYGFDHAVLLNGLNHLGKQARGVAVISPDTDEHVIETLQAAGIVGVRFNLVQRGATDESMLMRVAERVKPYGWHIQLHLLPMDLLRMSNQLMKLGVPIVLDHIARLATQEGISKQVQQEVLQLLDTGQAWLKLSGAYIASKNAPDFSDLDDAVVEILERYPDRVVWGSDWPHVTESKKPNDASLMNLLARWAPDEALREKILVDNPKVLYGF